MAVEFVQEMIEGQRKAPGQARAAENAEIQTAKSGAAAAGAQAMAGLTATRQETGAQVDSGKTETKSADEKKREQVTAKLQKVFDETKTDVEKTLDGLDGKVDTQFTNGEKRARDAFTADHERRMKAYKDKRYSGLRGKARWVKDKFGLSWQVVPTALVELLKGPDAAAAQRVTKAFLQMKKFDIAALKKAHAGA